MFLHRLLRGLLAGGQIDVLLEEVRARRQVARCAAATAGEGVFHPEARVLNHQQDPAAITLGAGTHVRGELLVFPFGGRIRMGRAGYLGPGSRIWSAESVEIGDHVLIAHGVTISDTNAHELDAEARAAGFQRLVREGHPKERPDVPTAPVTIHRHAWINYGCAITKGVTIGEGAIVGCGSVVTHDIPPYTLAAGQPARVIRTLR